MNQGHVKHLKRNRLSRLNKRLNDKDLPGEQRSRIQQRIAELQVELGVKK